MRATVRHRVLVMEHLDMDQPTDRGRAMDTHRRPTMAVTMHPLMVMAIRTRIYGPSVYFGFGGRWGYGRRW